MEISKYQNENAILQLVKKDWNFLSFKEVLVDKTSTVLKIPQNAYLKSGTTAIIDQGVKMIGGYSDLVGSRGEKECIIFGDHTRILKYIHPPFYIGADGVKVLENKKEDIVRTKFIYYYLKTIDIPNTGYNRHFKFLKEIVIPIIDIDIQDKIIKVIEMSEKLRQNRQSQLKALDELSQSLFLEMFGDTVNYVKVPIGKIFEVKSGKTPKRDNSEFWINGTVPWVKTGEVNMNYITSSQEFITRKALNNMDLLPVETILVAMYGQGRTRGRVGMLQMEATTNQACAAIIPNESINMHFVLKQLELNYNEIRSLGRGGNQQNLNLSSVKDFEIILPPINLQNEFAEKIQAIEAQKEQLTQSLVQYEELHQSLLQKAFRGELFQDVTN